MWWCVVLPGFALRCFELCFSAIIRRLPRRPGTFRPVHRRAVVVFFRAGVSDDEDVSLWQGGGLHSELVVRL